MVVGAFRGTEKFGVFFVRESILTACQVTDWKGRVRLTWESTLEQYSISTVSPYALR